MIINAEDLLLGRIATFAAKKALLGEKVNIINCEKAIISGNKKSILNRYEWKKKVGDTFKGPFFSKMPDRIVKRTIRGMLPYKKDRGRKAFSNIRCYVGIPKEFIDKESTIIEQAHLKKLQGNYLTVKEVSKHLGAHIK